METNSEITVTCKNYNENIDFFNENLHTKLKNDEELYQKYNFVIRFYLFKGLCYDPLRRPNRKISIIEENENNYMRFYDRNYLLKRGSSFVQLKLEDVNIIVKMTPYLSFNLLKKYQESIGLNQSGKEENNKKNIIALETSLLNIPSMSIFTNFSYNKNKINFQRKLSYLFIIGLIIGTIFASGGSLIIIGIVGFMTFVSVYSKIKKKEGGFLNTSKLHSILNDGLIGDIMKIYNFVLTYSYNKQYKSFYVKIIGIDSANSFVNLYFKETKIYQKKIRIYNQPQNIVVEGNNNVELSNYNQILTNEGLNSVEKSIWEIDDDEFVLNFQNLFENFVNIFLENLKIENKAELKNKFINILTQNNYLLNNYLDKGILYRKLDFLKNKVSLEINEWLEEVFKQKEVGGKRIKKKDQKKKLKPKTKTKSKKV
jgi:hypothetical protein